MQLERFSAVSRLGASMKIIYFLSRSRFSLETSWKGWDILPRKAARTCGCPKA